VLDDFLLRAMELLVSEDAAEQVERCRVVVRQAGIIGDIHLFPFGNR